MCAFQGAARLPRPPPRASLRRPTVPASMCPADAQDYDQGVWQGRAALLRHVRVPRRSGCPPLVRGHAGRCRRAQPARASTSTTSLNLAIPPQHQPGDLRDRVRRRVQVWRRRCHLRHDPPYASREVVAPAPSLPIHDRETPRAGWCCRAARPLQRRDPSLSPSGPRSVASHVDTSAGNFAAAFVIVKVTAPLRWVVELTLIPRMVDVIRQTPLAQPLGLRAVEESS